VDTPGVHRPRYKLGEKMNEDAQEALIGSDLILFLVDVSEPPADEDHLLASQIVSQKREAEQSSYSIKWIASIHPNYRNARCLSGLAAWVQVLAISATRATTAMCCWRTMLERLPEGEAYYPEEQITDLGERDIAANLVREAALIHLRDEISPMVWPCAWTSIPSAGIVVPTSQRRCLWSGRRTSPLSLGRVGSC